VSSARRWTRRAAAWLLALGAACATAPPLPGPAGGEGAPGDPAALSAEVLRLAREADREPPGARRAALAEAALAAGRRCDRAAPGTPGCDYALAIALGLDAREHPATAIPGLGRMVALLERTRAADPALDRAGPDRILALVLLRAPGWPLGPGDAEAALAAARRAVDRAPGHAPNQLALAEALEANGEAEAGRAAAREAVRLAAAAEEAGVPEAAGWRREAERRAGAR
jgi:hypothetical protein